MPIETHSIYVIPSNCGFSETELVTTQNRKPSDTGGLPKCEGVRGDGRAGLIFGTKNNSIRNILNLLFFLFFSINQVSWHFLRRARFGICSKLTTSCYCVSIANFDQ